MAVIMRSEYGDVTRQQIERAAADVVARWPSRDITRNYWWVRRAPRSMFTGEPARATVAPPAHLVEIVTVADGVRARDGDSPAFRWRTLCRRYLTGDVQIAPTPDALPTDWRRCRDCAGIVGEDPHPS